MKKKPKINLDQEEYNRVLRVLEAYSDKLSSEGNYMDVTPEGVEASKVLQFMKAKTK